MRHWLHCRQGAHGRRKPSTTVLHAHVPLEAANIAKCGCAGARTGTLRKQGGAPSGRRAQQQRRRGRLADAAAARAAQRARVPAWSGRAALAVEWNTPPGLGYFSEDRTDDRYAGLRQRLAVLGVSFGVSIRVSIRVSCRSGFRFTSFRYRVCFVLGCVPLRYENSCRFRRFHFSLVLRKERLIPPHRTLFQAPSPPTLLSLLRLHVSRVYSSLTAAAPAPVRTASSRAFLILSTGHAERPSSSLMKFSETVNPVLPAGVICGKCFRRALEDSPRDGSGT